MPPFRGVHGSTPRQSRSLRIHFLRDTAVLGWVCAITPLTHRRGTAAAAAALGNEIRRNRSSRYYSSGAEV